MEKLLPLAAAVMAALSINQAEAACPSCPYYQAAPSYQSYPRSSQGSSGYQDRGYQNSSDYQNPSDYQSSDYQKQPHYQSHGYYQSQGYKSQSGYPRQQPLYGKSASAGSDRFVLPDDEAIMIEVRETLSDPDVTENGHAIQITVDKGIVYLGGQIIAEFEKRQIGDAVRDIDGVVDVRWENPRNQNAPFKKQQSYHYQDYNNSPYSLAYDEDSELYANQYSDPRQSNPTQGPNQRASGDNPYAQPNTYQQSNQKMNPQGKAAYMSDADIKEKVLDKLLNTWFKKKYDTVQVEVRNQQVTLRGTVDSDSDIKEVENRVRQVPEVKGIVNELRIASKNSQGSPSHR